MLSIPAGNHGEHKWSQVDEKCDEEKREGGLSLVCTLKPNFNLKRDFVASDSKNWGNLDASQQRSEEKEKFGKRFHKRKYWSLQLFSPMVLKSLVGGKYSKNKEKIDKEDKERNYQIMEISYLLSKNSNFIMVI